MNVTQQGFVWSQGFFWNYNSVLVHGTHILFFATQKSSLEVPSLAFYSRFDFFYIHWTSFFPNKGHTWMRTWTVLEQLPLSSEGRDGDGQESTILSLGFFPPLASNIGSTQQRNIKGVEHPSLPRDLKAPECFILVNLCWSWIWTLWQQLWGALAHNKKQGCSTLPVPPRLHPSEGTPLK